MLIHDNLHSLILLNIKLTLITDYNFAELLLYLQISFIPSDIKKKTQKKKTKNKPLLTYSVNS